MNNPIMNMLGMNNVIPPQIMQLAQLMRGGGDMQSMLGIMANQYPELNLFLQNSGGANPQNMEQFCRMICQQKGIDFNTVYQQAQQMAKQLNM